MLYGETESIQQAVTDGGAAFTISAASVTVYDAARTVVTGPVTPSVTPGTSATSQTVAYGFTPPSAGVFDVEFSLTVGSAVKFFPRRIVVTSARGYPTASDLSGYLADQGITDAVSSLRLDQVIRSVITAFERAVDRKMVAGVAAPDTFSPPPDRSGILFLPDFISLTSLVYQPQNSAAETFALATDYTLQPNGALGVSGPYAPYSAISFTRFWSQPMWPALANSLTITARWGYAASMPDDAWEAILGRAASRLLVPLGVTGSGGTKGITSESGGGESVSYASAGRYAGMTAVLEQNWMDAVQRYRRMSI